MSIPSPLCFHLPIKIATPNDFQLKQHGIWYFDLRESR